MRVVLVRGYGDQNQLSYGDTPNLKQGPGEYWSEWRRPTIPQGLNSWHTRSQPADSPFPSDENSNSPIDDMQFRSEKGGIGKIILVA